MPIFMEWYHGALPLSELNWCRCGRFIWVSKNSGFFDYYVWCGCWEKELGCYRASQNIGVHSWIMYSPTILTFFIQQQSLLTVLYHMWQYLTVKISHLTYSSLYNISLMLKEPLKYHIQWTTTGKISRPYFCNIFTVSLGMYVMWNITPIHSSWFSCWTFQKLVFGNSFWIHLISKLHV